MSINIKKKALNVKNGDTYDNFDMFFLGDVGEAVDDWFEEHPEAVTNVADNSITAAKLAPDVREDVESIDDLKSALNDLPYAVYNGDYTDGYYIDANGALQPQTGWSVTNFLRIETKAVYYIKTRITSDAVKSCYYDKAQNPISVFKTDKAGRNIIYAPENAVFVRFSVYSTDITDFLYRAFLSMPYENNAIESNFLYANEYAKDAMQYLIDNGFRDANGVFGYNANWKCTELIPVKKYDIITLTGVQGIYAILYDEHKTVLSSKSTGNTPVSAEFVIDNEKYVAFNIVVANLNTFSAKINGVNAGAKYTIPWIYSEPMKIWKNKRYISHGDSITWQDGKAYIQGEHTGEIARGYQTIFNEYEGLISYNNQGKSGYPMAVVNGNGIVNTVKAVSNYNRYDLCTIAAGTNDFKLNVPLGNKGAIGDTTFDDTTFFGAYRDAIEYILNSYPKIRIVLLTPLQRDNDGYDVNYTNSAGAKLIDYVNATKAIGEMYGLPVCDMYRNSGFTAKTLSTYTMDGLHPNDIGYERMGGYLTWFLNSIGN